MRIAYADPPYLGVAAKLYGDHPDAAVYDTVEGHRALIGSLADYDGWALSLSVPSLRHLLPLCPEDARVAAWVKPFAAFKKGVNPAYTWEPVIFKSARGAKDRVLPEEGGGLTTVRDHLSCPITLKRGLTGAKPEAFCLWVFGLTGARPSDEFVDVFPGSEAVGRAWERYSMSFDGVLAS